MKIKDNIYYFSKTELDILIKIFNNTNFNNPVSTNNIIKKAEIYRDPIFENIKNLLKDKQIFKVKNIYGNLELIKINYVWLGDLIENSYTYKNLYKFIKIRGK